jgi:hypothetical protein
MVLLPPDLCFSASHDGITYSPDDEGAFVVPAHVATVLIESHGFIALSE